MTRNYAPRASEPSDSDEPHLPGTLLRTDNPLVGVLVEHDERRLVTTTAIPEGKVLFRIEGHETSTPTKYSLQVGRDLHLDQRGARDANDRVRRFYWRYMNHACEPTTTIRDREVVALRDIVALESVTFDYNTTEFDLAAPFTCRCGSRHCVGVVRGAAHLTPAQRARVADRLPDYLR